MRRKRNSKGGISKRALNSRALHADALLKRICSPKRKRSKTMSSNEETTDPGISAKAHKAALKAQEAARKADPYADRLLGRIQGSEWSAVLIVLVVLALVGFGRWL